MMIMDNTLTWDDFMKVEMRAGTIVSAEVFKEAWLILANTVRERLPHKSRNCTNPIRSSASKS